MWRDQIKRKPGKLAKAKGAQLAGQRVMTALLHSCTNPLHYPQHRRLIVQSSIIVYYQVSYENGPPLHKLTPSAPSSAHSTGCIVLSNIVQRRPCCTLAQIRYTNLSTGACMYTIIYHCILSSICIVYYQVWLSCTNLFCTIFDAHDARTALDDCSSEYYLVC